MAPITSHRYFWLVASQGWCGPRQQNRGPHPPAWVDIRQVSGTPEADILPLDGGEQEAILLAQELHADLVLLDDREARKAALSRASRVMGTVGVLEQAAIHELIDLPGVCARLLTTNFRIKDSIIHNVLARDAARKAAAHAQSPEPQET